MGKKFDSELAEYLYDHVDPDREVGSSSEGVGWAGMYGAGDKIHIVQESPGGTVAAFTYPEVESVLRWAEVSEELDMSGDEPEEGDYVIEDGIGGYTVSQYGKTWTFDTWTDAEEFVTADRESSGFFPNVWHLSDHGNYTLWKFERKAS